MVSTELLERVAALSVDDQTELIGFIEHSLDFAAVPTAEQQQVVSLRVAEMKANPELGLTVEEAIAAARAMAR